jgi:hypothetical protein
MSNLSESMIEEKRKVFDVKISKQVTSSSFLKISEFR